MEITLRQGKPVCGPRSILYWICTALLFLAGPGFSGAAYSAERVAVYTLPEAIDLALRNNPKIASASKDAEIGADEVDAARAQKQLKVGLTGGTTRYNQPMAVTPISGSPFQGVPFPEFDRQIYDVGVSFSLPLYKGGQLDRGVSVAGSKKTAAEHLLEWNRQELVYNITSVYYKILQLEKLREAREETVRQLEAHRRDAELFLRAGTVPRLDLIRADAELSLARHAVLLAINSAEDARDTLLTLMGIDDPEIRVSVIHGDYVDRKEAVPSEYVEKALSGRPDFRALWERQRASEEAVRVAEGKKLPFVNLAGEYTERSGSGFDFQDNWYIALRLSMPLFDGGIIRTEVNRLKKESEKAKEEVREAKNRIVREVKEAVRNIENAADRIKVCEAAMKSAEENLRVERLKYGSGTGRSTDVIDSGALLLRSQTDYYQALYDRAGAWALLRKVTGDDINMETSR